MKNRLKLLERGLLSVLHQTITELEVIVVDDGSDEDQKPKKLAIINDTRVVCLEAKQGNANTTRNKGVEYATGEYIAFLDSDDEWKPNHLEKCLETLMKSKADLVYGGAETNNKDGYTICFV